MATINLECGQRFLMYLQELLDFEMLFDPFEEQLHSPAILVEIGNSTNADASDRLSGTVYITPVSSSRKNTHTEFFGVDFPSFYKP